jgi:hypothetical protein
LDALLDVHPHCDVPTDPDPPTHLHADEHADTSAGNECHLHFDAIPNLDTDKLPHTIRNTHRHQHPNRHSHIHRHRDRFAHTDAYPHTDGHSYADPYPNPYMDTDTYHDTNAKPHLHLHPNCNHHNDRYSTAALILSMAISNERIL